MKVWIVYDPFYDPPVAGVFATRALAQKCLDEEEPQPGTGCKYLMMDEYEVEEEPHVR